MTMIMIMIMIMIMTMTVIMIMTCCGPRTACSAKDISLPEFEVDVRGVLLKSHVPRDWSAKWVVNVHLKLK